MTAVTVTRQVRENYREEWSFDLSFNGLRLTKYERQSKNMATGRWRKAGPDDRWDSTDERSYHSGLPRPQNIPDTVIEEALKKIRLPVYIGFFNEKCWLTDLELKTEKIKRTGGKK